MVVKPYTETDLGNNLFRRIFHSNTNPTELVWHRDYEDRTMTVLFGDDWEFQFDNELPFKLYTGTTVDIPMGVYHRMIKGGGPLMIEVQKSG